MILKLNLNSLKMPKSVEGVVEVKDFQLQDGDDSVPALPRTIHAGEDPFVVDRKAACKSMQEIIASPSFKRFLEIFAERKGITNLKFFLKTIALLKSDELEIDDKENLLTRVGLDNKNSDELKDFAADVNSSLDFWVGLRSRLQIHNLAADACEEQAKLEEAILEFIERANKVFGILELPPIDIEKHPSLAACLTATGQPRNSYSKTFRVKTSTHSKGLNVETSRKRRRKAKISTRTNYKNNVPRERDILGEKSWVERRFSVGGICVSIFFRDDYAHLLPGAENLFRDLSGKSIESDSNGDDPPKIKMYFGVDPKKMEGEERIICSRHDELRLMVAAIKGKDGLSPEDSNYDWMEYFGYLKKSLLTLTNSWNTIISAVTSAKYFLDRGMQKEHDELLENFPVPLRDLQGKLFELLDTKPEEFQKLLPKFDIPEIDYYPNEAGFDSGRYLFIPVHGAAYTIKIGDKTINFVLPGDSGVGKSEVMRMLEGEGECEIEEVQADDMLSLIFDRQTGKTFSVGTEGGAFTKTDDLPLGTLQTTNHHPIVGYNAAEPTGNRRVVESSISKTTPKKVDAFLALVNSDSKKGNQSRFKELSLEEFVELWIEGPYRPSSSVEGGGKESKKTFVAFWNVFIANGLRGIIKKLVRQMFVDDPTDWGAKTKIAGSQLEDDATRTNEVESIIEARRGIQALLLNTCPSKGKGLNDTFEEAARDLVAGIRQLI